MPQSHNPPDVEDTSAQSSPNTPTTGKLHMADGTVLKKVTWPHEVMFTPEGRTAVYGELSVMACLRGNLIVMDSQPQDTKALMDSHLADLMEDREVYGWPLVRDFHSTWLQHIEMGRATWDNHATKLKLRHTLVLCRVTSPNQGSSPITARRCNSPTTQPTNYLPTPALRPKALPPSSPLPENIQSNGTPRQRCVQWVQYGSVP